MSSAYDMPARTLARWGPTFARLRAEGVLGDDGIARFGGAWDADDWKQGVTGRPPDGTSLDVYRVDAALAPIDADPAHPRASLLAVGFGFLQTDQWFMPVGLPKYENSLTFLTPVILPSATTFQIVFKGQPGAKFSACVTLYALFKTSMVVG